MALDLCEHDVYLTTWKAFRRGMPCNRIVLKWEVWPSSVEQSVQLSPYLMWGQLRHLLLACRHDEGYLATGSYENEDENENTEDRSKDPIYIQVHQICISVN